MAVIENRATDPSTNQAFVIFGHLFDFQIGSAVLRDDHEEWLSSVAAPFLNGNPESTFVTFGLASRSGTAKRNEILSEQRINSVLTFLTTLGVASDKNVSNQVVGERAGQRAGQRDGTEDKLLRAVSVQLWSINLRTITEGVQSLKRKQAGLFF